MSFAFLILKSTGNTELKNAEVTGAFESDLRDLKTLPNYKNKNPKYNDYNKFSVLEDAWNWFNMLLPKNFSTLKTSFVGYMQIQNEEGGVRTERMFCRIK